jgi:hypothetical protein
MSKAAAATSVSRKYADRVRRHDGVNCTVAALVRPVRGTCGSSALARMDPQTRTGLRVRPRLSFTLASELRPTVLSVPLSFWSAVNVRSSL